MSEDFQLFKQKVTGRVNVLNEQIKRLSKDRTRNQRKEEEYRNYAHNCTIAIEVARMERLALIEAARKKEKEHTV